MRTTKAAVLFAMLVSVAFSAQGKTGEKSTVRLGVDRVLAKHDENVLKVQVLLDRQHHSPGVIDGLMGSNTIRAIKAFQEEAGLPVDGKIGEQLISKLQVGSSAITGTYTIKPEDVAGPFQDTPALMTDQAEMTSLSFENAVEALAEKFHVSPSLLRNMNPGKDLAKPGTAIAVVDAGDDTLSQRITRIEVHKQSSAVRAYSSDGTLVATYPATVGSQTFPSPEGVMEVQAVALNPKYYFDPEGREWGPDERLTIAAGPNNPVGSTWIDLSKDGYGIHGTPEPGLIGKTASHGCVRLTNWDAAELGKAVEQGATVTFV